MSTKNHIAVLGSSRSFGNTRKVLEEIIAARDIPLVDLNTLDISTFDYENRNQNDDYLLLMERLVTYDTIILATPVYWYAMSAVMKTFIDRLSDLLTIRKDIGRKLRGKKVYVIATYDTSYPPAGFTEVFALICDYMGMNFLGASIFYAGDENLELLKRNQAERELAVAALARV